MVTCKKCNSISVKVSDLNFATVKPEGQPAAKIGHTKKEFYCHSCGEIWMFDLECERLYFEYLDLKRKTMMFVQDLRSLNKIPPPHIESHDLMRRNELAKKLVTGYKHMLDIDPGEWHELEQEALI
ncbi:MAG: hypothetical protein R3B39_02380 [Candidatus Paceibacterota bacterium]